MIATFAQYARLNKGAEIAEEHFIATLAWCEQQSRGAWTSYDFATLAAGLDWKGSRAALRAVVEVLQEAGCLTFRRGNAGDEFKVPRQLCGHSVADITSDGPGAHHSATCTSAA